LLNLQKINNKNFLEIIKLILIMKAITNPKGRANSIGIQPKISEVKLHLDPNKKNKFIPRSNK